MVACAVELLESRIIYEQRKAIKAQALVNFVVEMTNSEVEQPIQHEWTLYMDGSSNGKGSGVGVRLKGLNDMILEYSLKFNFKAINNQAKYEALIASLQLAKEIGVQALNIRSDS